MDGEQDGDWDREDWSWPNASHDLTTPPSGYHAYADLAWQRGRGMYGRISGFRTSAEVLFERMVGSRSVADLDTLIYPYASNWAHHIELKLKALLPDLRQLAGQRHRQSLTHNLAALWSEVRVLLEELWPDDVSAVEHVDRVVLQLHAMDPHGQAFRYDRDRKGNPTLGSVDYIDLPAFQEALEGVSNFLSGVEGQADHAMQSVPGWDG